ncbi:MAG: HEPN domain-containing protein [Bacteroidota bacterium]
MQTYTNDLTIQKATSEFQVSNFFKHYPIEYVQENIAALFEKVIPHPTENPSIPSTYLFYEELNLVLKNCEFLYKYEKSATKVNSIHPVVRFLKEVIPASYIFCSRASAFRTDLIIVMDQYKYKSFDEIHTLLDFAVLGHKKINCTVYTYATIHEFLSKGHLYFSAICTPENCLYKNATNIALPLLSTEKCLELIDTSTQLFNQNIQKALTFFNGARSLANESECTVSGFMIQQACELTFRSLLLSLRGKQVKCHDLVVLRKHLSHFAPTIIGIFDKDEEKEIKLLTSIQEAYIRSRYDQTYKISNNELEKFILAASKLIQNAKQIFNYHCQKVKTLSYL